MIEMNKQERGFTLIELLLVLGTLSLLAIAAFVVYPMVMDSYHGKIDREFLATASTNIIELFQSSRRFGPNPTTDVSYLSDLQYSGQLSWALPGTLCHPFFPNLPEPVLCTDAFGNPFFWSTMSVVNPDGTLNPFQLQATFQDLSPQQCIQLLQYGVGAFRANQIEIIRSGERTICVQPFTDPAALVRACSGGDLPDGTSGFIDGFQIEWSPWGRPYWMSPEYGWCQNAT